MRISYVIHMGLDTAYMAAWRVEELVSCFLSIAVGEVVQKNLL